MANSRAPALPFILVTVVIDAIGIGLIIPVLPALVGEFTHSPDAQAYWYGAVTACFGIAQFLCGPLLGALSDRYGRRPLLLLGMAGLGLNFAITALATQLWMLMASRIIGGSLAANLAVANAYAADITPPEQRAKRFGALGAAFGVGFIFGPVIGGVLGAHDVRWPFFAAAGLCAINWLYGLLVLPESLPRERRNRHAPLLKASPFNALKGLANLRSIGPLVVVIALSSLAQFSMYTIWVLYTGHRFGWGPQQTGLSLFIAGVVGVVMQGMLLGKVLDTFGRRRVAVWGLVSGTLAYAAYGLATEGVWMYVIMMANALSVCVPPAFQSFISAAAPADKQGQTLGAVSSLNSLMAVLAPLIAAPLFAQVSHLPSNDWRVGAPFFLCAALQGIGLLLTWRHFAAARAASPQRA